jgi:hypothetical protein
MNIFEYMDHNPWGSFIIVSVSVASFFTVLNNAVKVWGSKHGVNPDELRDTDD